MKTSLWMSMLALMVLPVGAQEPLAIVLARVQELQEVPPPVIPPEELKEILRPDGTLPTPPKEWVAKFKIEHVFSGDTSLVGQSMYKSTMDEMPAGSSRPVTPRLDIGDMGVFAIKRVANGMLVPPPFDQPVLPEGQLPLIKGRHAGYERAVERLMGKVDNKGPGINPLATPSQSTATPGGTEAKSSPPAMTGASKPASETPPSLAWIIGGILMLVLAVLYLIFRPRHT